MSIASEIQRLTGLRNRLRTKLIGLGLINDNNADLEDCVESIEGIQGLGGSEEAEDKDINFYDLDGKRLFSYTRAEFALLDSLPTAPNRPELFLNFCCWNWTKAEITTHKGYVEVGALYEPSDCDAWFLVDIATAEQKNFSINKIKAGSGNTVEIDWGDGTQESITSSTALPISHTYQHCGIYRLKVTRISGTASMDIGGNSGTEFFVGSSTSALTYTIKEIYLGSNIQTYNSSFANVNIRRISVGENTRMRVRLTSKPSMIPCYCYSRNTNTGTYGNYLPPVSSSLKKSIPSGNLSSYVFNQTNAFRGIGKGKLTIPDTTTTIGIRCLCDEFIIEHIHIPSSVTTILEQGISLPSNCDRPYDIWFYGSPPTLSASNSIILQQTKPDFLVPYEYLASYLNWTNQPDITVYTYIGHYNSTEGVNLPTIDLTSNYSLTWYSSLQDALALENSISTGTGDQVFCTWQEVSS